MKLYERYDNIYRSNIELIRDNQIKVDPLPIEGEDRWGVSAVFRPKFPSEVWRDLEQLKTVLGQQHAYYHENNVHITFRSLEAYRDNIGSSDELIKQYAHELENVLRDAGSMTVSLSGIIGVASGLILGGIPNFDIEKLRLEFFTRLREKGLVTSGPETSVSQLRNTCHASLAVFASKLSLADESHDALSKLHQKSYGDIQLHDIEIVAYKRTLSAIDVKSLAKITLS
ncbi:hypothetical protein F9817_18380 [Vibrio sp. CAIM 722]|uniref:Uncharacterized protein n=1 Tax=Vibrio eleionomae TaxID=2653505 RepID=A0A7X4LNG9_9VIBR|nr:hypothetical protein [Vibrio eleionomae]MZI95149.1 hypothetical protein [Vibrio eleionomae]